MKAQNRAGEPPPPNSIGDSGQGGSHAAGHGGHTGGPSLALYMGVFAALLVLTGMTVWVAFLPIGAWHTPVALGIAGLKAALVMLYFMHLRWSSKLTVVFALVGFLFLAILLVFTLADFQSRSWLLLYE